MQIYGLAANEGLESLWRGRSGNSARLYRVFDEATYRRTLFRHSRPSAEPLPLWASMYAHYIQADHPSRGH